MLQFMRTSLISRAYREETQHGEAGGGAPADAPFDPVSAIGGLLNDDGAFRIEEPQDQHTPEPQDQNTPQPQDQHQDPQDPNQDPQDQNQDPQPQDPNTPEVEEIELNGKKYAVPKELKDSFLMHADYTRKTMDLAEQRKAFDAQRQAVEQERQAYAQNLQYLNQVLQQATAQDAQIDWQTLLANDPQEYLRQKEMSEQRQRALAQVQMENQRLEQVRQYEATQRQQALVQQQRELLLARLPDWKDPEKAKTEQAELRSFLAKEGYSDQEIASAIDHRSILLARDAMLYRKMMANANVAGKQIERVPPKVERPGVSDPADAQTERQQQSIRRLRQTHHIDDAAAAIENLL